MKDFPACAERINVAKTLVGARDGSPLCLYLLLLLLLVFVLVLYYLSI
jgi:hypothetical protein